MTLSLAAAGCGSSSSATTTAPTVTLTETFSGTVNVGSSDFHTFTMSTSGQVAVTLTAAAPPANIIMGLAIGSPNGTTCTPLAGASITTASGASPELMGDVSGGTLCVLVSDVGNETAPITYTVSVTHP